MRLFYGQYKKDKCNETDDKLRLTHFYWHRIMKKFLYMEGLLYEKKLRRNKTMCHNKT